MSLRKLTASLLTALVMLSGFSTASAQTGGPVQDPFTFDPDFRWFEPIYDMDLADLKPKKRAATGWFGTYDRLLMYGSRPELNVNAANADQLGETLMDRGYGHRYEVGFMTDQDSGWCFTSTEIGVGAFITTPTQRLNRFVVDGDITQQPPFGRPVPESDGNNLGFNERLYFVQDTENVFSFDSYELNKTWRMEPYHYGGILEPMIGARWIKIRDLDSVQNYISSEDLDAPGGPPFANTFGDAEQLTTDQSVTRNDALAAQLGFRYFKFQNRFTYSTAFKVFAGGSWQSTYFTRVQDITVYDGAGSGSLVVDQIYRTLVPPTYHRNDEFLLGFDVRGEVSYQLAKMIQIRTGFQVIDVARGVWRGGVTDGVSLTGGDNDQDLLMAGVTFGIELNR